MHAMPTQRREAMPVSHSGWSGGWQAVRDRLLASRVFQRRASIFPLTAPIARGRARELFDLVAGFVYSQVLLACVQLDLFDILAEGPQSSSALAVRLGLPRASADRLLAAAVSLQLVERRGEGEYGLGKLGAPMVGNVAVSVMVEHHVALYKDLADPVALLRGKPTTDALAHFWPYADTVAEAPDELPAASVAGYSTLMSSSQPLVAQEILDAYPLARHSCVLDVGGGEGSFIIQLAAHAPKLQLQLFDLPAVAERARVFCDAAGIGDRVRISGGSFLRDPLPTGADAATLVRVIHDHDDASALRILHAVHRALPLDGTILIAEPMAGTPGAEPVGDAYFGFYLMAMGRGRPRTADELCALLLAAGFEDVRQLKTHMPLQTGLLVAHAGRPVSKPALHVVKS